MILLPGPKQNEQSSRPAFTPREKVKGLRAKEKAKTKQKLALRLQATLGTLVVGGLDRRGTAAEAGTGVEMALC